jgi:hypothetical protein
MLAIVSFVLRRLGVCLFPVVRKNYLSLTRSMAKRGYGACARFHAEVNIIPAYTESASWITSSTTSAIIPALEAAYSSAPELKRIKALLTSNPNNPFMRCWPKDVVCEMINFCQRHGLHYISDEVFANTVFDPKADQFVSALSLLHNPDEKQGVSQEDRKSIIEPSLVHVVWSTTKDFGAWSYSQPISTISQLPPKPKDTDAKRKNESGLRPHLPPLVRYGVSFA